MVDLNTPLCMMTLGQLWEALHTLNCTAVEPKSETRMPIATRVVDMVISIRLFNRLKAMGCDTLEDILRKRAIDFKQCPGFGPRSFQELSEFLEEHGYKFGELVNENDHE